MHALPDLVDSPTLYPPCVSAASTTIIVASKFAVCAGGAMHGTALMAMASKRLCMRLADGLMVYLIFFHHVLCHPQKKAVAPGLGPKNHCNLPFILSMPLGVRGCIATLTATATVFSVVLGRFSTKFGQKEPFSNPADCRLGLGRGGWGRRNKFLIPGGIFVLGGGRWGGGGRYEKKLVGPTQKTFSSHVTRTTHNHGVPTV